MPRVVPVALLCIRVCEAQRCFENKVDACAACDDAMGIERVFVSAELTHGRLAPGCGTVAPNPASRTDSDSVRIRISERHCTASLAIKASGRVNRRRTSILI